MGLTDTDIDLLVRDESGAGVFSVHRDVFTDRAVFELEMAHIFEGTWVFVGFENQVSDPHDFFTTVIGRQPVIVMRDAGGQLRCFLNSCRHRGTLVCPQMSGNKKVHVCQYHGWVYNSGGENVSIPGQDEAEYPEAFSRENHDLVPVARFASYRGLLFASLSADVPSLEEHLGEARAFIDLVVDQGRRGLETIPDAITYTYDGNWKLQFENGLDFYHFASTHKSYAKVVQDRLRNVELASKGLIDDEPIGQGTFSFDRGHAIMWSNFNPFSVHRPLQLDPRRIEEVSTGFGKARLKWMMFNRNLTIFPNLQIIDISSLQFRAWRPLAADKTEMVSFCVGPIGEPPEARRARIRQYEDFFSPSGLASSDDNVMYEFCQTGLEARAAGSTQGHLRGTGAGRNNSHAAELGIKPVGSASGSIFLGDETCFHTGYREWSRLMKKGITKRSPHGSG